MAIIGGGGEFVPLGSVFIRGTVDTYAELPPAGDHVNELYVVTTTTGSVLLFNRKQSGIYRSDGATWSRLDKNVTLFGDDLFEVYNAVDQTKRVSFDASQIATGTKRVMLWQNRDGMIALTDIQGNAGWVSGGDLIDNLDGTFDITAGTGYIRSSNSDSAAMAEISWTLMENLAPAEDIANIVFYNGSTGNIEITSDTSVVNNGNDKFELYSVVLEGTVLHTTDHKHVALNVGSLVQERFHDEFHFSISSGSKLADIGTRNIQVTAGVGWIKLIKQNMPAVDTTGSDTFDSYYQDGLGGVAKLSAQTQWDNSSWDDGTGVLATLNASKYANLWWYLEPDGGLVCVYGTAEYSILANALNEPAPSVIPARSKFHGTIIAQLTFQQGAATASNIASFTNGELTSSAITNHSDLAGLTNLDHPVTAIIGEKHSTLEGDLQNEEARINGLYAGAGYLEKADFITGTTANTFTVPATEYVTGGYYNNISQTNIVLSAAPSTTSPLYREDLVMLEVSTVDGTASYVVTDNASDPASAGYVAHATSNGVYTKVGAFAQEVAIVSRRNQGAYHQKYNPNGTKKFSDNKFWYETTVIITSTADCFVPGNLLTASGYISSGVSGRSHDGLFYDQIHMSDIMDLRMCAKHVTATPDSILAEYVANNVRGVENEAQTKKITVTVTDSANSGADIQFDEINAVADEIGVGDYYTVERYVYRKIYAIDGAGNVWTGSNLGAFNWLRFRDATTGANVNTGIAVNDTIDIYFEAQTAPRSSGEMTHTDIFVGTTADISAVDGMSGTVVLVDENGNDARATGSSKFFKATRKVKTVLEVLWSIDGGATWTNDPSYIASFNPTTNGFISALSTSILFILTYTTYPSTMETSIRKNVQFNELSGAVALNSAIAGQGVELVSMLIGKVPESTATPGTRMGIALGEYTIIDGLLATASSYAPQHNTIDISANTPAVKVFAHTTIKNGLEYPVFIFKEMRHNGTSWGDNDQFEITDNISTIVDTNGKTVLYGTMIGKTPIGFASEVA